MASNRYSIVTAEERGDLLTVADEIVPAAWPEFCLNDPVGNEYWNALYEVFPGCQFLLIEKESGHVVVSANSIPLTWQGNFENLPDDGWRWALREGFENHRKGVQPNVLCALSVTVAVEHRGRKASRHAVRAMTGIAAAAGLSHVIAPVRPSMKAQYPLIPIERYLQWRTDDGRPFDPWMRVHAALGAETRHVCHRSMVIPGSVDQWEKWAGMPFPETGDYVVPGALNPVHIDCENDRGEYVEPNVWMVHALEPPA